MPELNIEQILQSERAWEFILLDIVQSEDLDPWDIDITNLTHNYTERINKMKKLDLRIPARLILAAAILLKLQSEGLIMTEEEEQLFEDMFLNDETVSTDEEDEIPILDLRLRRKPSRKITLSDLIKTLNKTLDKPEKQPRYLSEPFELKLEEEDITEQIDKLHGKILKSHLEKVAFSSLLPEKSKEEVIRTLLPLLHLANERKIDLEQEEFFKEIFVSTRKKD